MSRYTRACVAFSLALACGGCDDFLTGPGLTDNPNNPVDASITAQLVAIQANMFTVLQGQVARNATIYTQQIIGSNNQQQLWGTRYLVSEGDISTMFNAFYSGAGLSGLRKVQALANAEGNPLIEGIAKIWEGYAFGTATSVWGDIPYSEASNLEILT